MPLLEQLAYGLGLGMMAMAALTLGIKLCGFHGYRVVFLVTAMGAFRKSAATAKPIGRALPIIAGNWFVAPSPLPC